MEKFNKKDAIKGDEIKVRFPTAADCVTHKDYATLYANDNIKMLDQLLNAEDIGKEVILICQHAGGYYSNLTNVIYNNDIFKYVTVIEYAPKKPVCLVPPTTDPVNRPSHYTTGKIECIDFIEDKELGFRLGNTVKYIVRAEHKGNKLQDLEKARWYLDREISSIKSEA